MIDESNDLYAFDIKEVRNQVHEEISSFTHDSLWTHSAPITDTIDVFTNHSNIYIAAIL